MQLKHDEIYYALIPKINIYLNIFIYILFSFLVVYQIKKEKTVSKQCCLCFIWILGNLNLPRCSLFLNCQTM